MNFAEQIAPLNPVPIDSDQVMAQVACKDVYRDEWVMFFLQNGRLRRLKIDGRELAEFLEWMESEVQRSTKPPRPHALHLVERKTRG